MNPHENQHDMHDETNAADEREALLTAYALGETDDAQTREVEALIAQDEALRAQVEEIGVTAALLTAGFAAESGEHLPAEAREAVTAAAASEQPASAGRVHSLWPLVGMAASVGFGIGLAAWWGTPVSSGTQTAGATEAPSRDDSSQASSALHHLGYIAGERPRTRPGDAASGELEGTFDGVFFGSAGRGDRAREVKDVSGRDLGGRLSVGGGGNAGGPTAPQGPGAESGPVPFPAKPGGDAGGGESGVTAAPVFGRKTPVGTDVDVVVGGAGGGDGVRLVRGVDGGGAPTTGSGSVGGPTTPGGGGPTVRGGAYVGPAGEVPPAPRAPSDSPPVPGTTLEVHGGARVVGEPVILRVQVERLQTQVEQTLAANIDLPGAALPDVRVMQRFLEVTSDQNEIDPELLVQATAAYERAFAAVRRRKAERFRDRHGLSYGVPGTEDYAHPGESVFRDPAEEPLSTFSIDVDTASYANVRRFLNNGQLPPPAAVRIEEMVNYFTYSDPLPQGEHPIAATLETATCPWNTRSRLVRIGVTAKTFDEPPPPANLVFLIDVSGSMQPADKLPLLQQAMKMLADQMREGDRVAIVTYASNSGVRLQSTDGSQKDTIKACIDGLAANGSTNGGAGIIDAYRIAREHFIEGGTNRVILATDGDFNVGVTDRGELTDLIERQRESGVFLSVLGVGTGNLKDATLENLADRGNGNYHYLDGLREARKVLVDDLMGTVVTVAKDVKLQLEFNPAKVGAYRLIGYENRMLAAADFNDDTKDAGEMGAGHTVTALYEIVPAGTAPQEGVDPLRYQKSPPAELTEAARSGELLTLKVRYKLPAASESTRFDMTLTDSGAKFDEASEDLRFASAVASFGMLLRGSPAAAGTSYDAVLELAQGAIGEDPGGHRAQMLDLVLKAKKLSGR